MKPDVDVRKNFQQKKKKTKISQKKAKGSKTTFVS